nr:hypothetical protein [uncultured Methylotenera sp.]
MPVRFEINDGRLLVIQSFDFPAIYLDHWAIRQLSSDPILGNRFLSALKASGGSLVISHANLAEITGATDPRHADEIAKFLEAVLPNIYFAMFNVEKAIDQENVTRDTNIRLKAAPDIDLLLEVARQRQDDFQPFTIAGVINAIAENREKLNTTWMESNRELADQINNVRSNVETVKQAQNFKGHPSHVPTLAVMQELLRAIFLDKTLTIGPNDAGDMHHAITSITYCDYVLLDGKWEDLYGRMVRRFAKLELQIRLAKVFSERRRGLESFLSDLENHGTVIAA